jgi:exonuclease III
MPADGAPSFTFASWNVKGRAIRPQNPMSPNYVKHLLAPYGAADARPIDVVVLQEARWSFVDKLYRTGKFAGYKFSLPEGSNDKGCAVFWSDRFTFVSLDETILSRQFMCLNLCNAEFGVLSVFNLHVPNGSNYGVRFGDLKRKVGDQISDLLVERRSRTVLGMDANSPKVDHPDRTREGLLDTDLYASDSRRLLGPQVSHNTRDAFRLYLEAHPEEYDRIRRARPEGPLAASFFTQKRDAQKTLILHRFDHIYVTPDLGVDSVMYYPLNCKVYDSKEGQRRGRADSKLSDHALVFASLHAV